MCKYMRSKILMVDSVRKGIWIRNFIKINLNQGGKINGIFIRTVIN